MTLNTDKNTRAEVVRRRRQQETRRRFQSVAQQATTVRPLISRPRRVEGQGLKPLRRMRGSGLSLPGGLTLDLPNFDLAGVMGTWRMMSLLLVVLLSVMLLRLLTDRQMYVTAVNLGGAALVPAEEIFANSGLAGQHIFWVDPAVAEARLVKIPGIAAAHVEVAWPARVTIVVEERTPQLILQDGEKKWWVDAAGQTFQSRGDLPGLLPIVAEGGQPLTAMSPEAVQGALQLKQLRQNIEKLYYQPTRGLSYQDGRGWRGYFGVGGQMAQKLSIYERLVAELVKQGLTPREIDVTDLNAPYYLR